MLADTVQELIAGEDVRHSIVRLPDYLVTRFREVRLLQEELDTLISTLSERGGGLFGLGRSMPKEQVAVYRSRIADIKAQLQGLINVAEAIRLGYEPYTPPGSWWIGYLDSPPTIPLFDDRLLRTVFQAPIPSEVLEKQRRAKATGLFHKRYVVAAPERSLFHSVIGLRWDPALIGFVPVERNAVILEGHGKPGMTMRNGASFLIAMWGQEKDRKSAGLDF